MALPCSSATAGEKALADLQKILRGFGCQRFGVMTDDEKKEIILQFEYRGMPVQVKASIRGYAAAWLKENPWSTRRKRSEIEHQREAMEIASSAVYSMLRDWIKGQTVAIETGMLSFEGAFLGQILLPSGQTVLDHAREKNLLRITSKAEASDE